ncbi:DNRLRE domain-containing protein [Actinokineospora sp. PR83]|uniref:LamG-like jellyroll fold domain-containing protein n=1 Tax=Actinokineospora sp. PR83 TaxID=2884908 RepID=UPI001F47FEC1|nr:LamG-like jellyroll fold domain-containing protein [Actinokineospora sp. PR83]MCG8918149.1 DNRLRE domain-containing protein [Actinokineospora sp. PR83]
MAAALLAPVLSVVPAAAEPVPAAVPDEVATESGASAAARAGGRSVRVGDLTDETTEVVANPNGTFTLTQHRLPVRVRRGGEWTPVDTTLVRRVDGSVAPKAAAVDLTVSGGGTAPLVALAADGARTGLTWPTPLPAPVLDGPTATYPEVLPGVDLKVTADVVGFSQVLVVKTPAAAAGVDQVVFGAPGVELAEGQGRGHDNSGPATETPDGVQARNAQGEAVLKGDASRMWDSSGEATPEDRLRGTGVGARTAVMDVEVGDGTIAVAPDQDFLAASTTRYPVYLDPGYGCTSCGKTHHVVVQSAWPNALNFDRTDGVLNELKAGYVCEGSCFVSRTYLRMSTAALAGKAINNAYLHLHVLHSYQCGSAQHTELWTANWVDAGTTWNNQPGGAAWQSSSNTTNNGTYCPSNGGMDLGAKNAITSAAANGYGETVFLVKGANETSNASWRRFDLNPYLVVEYNSYPNQPQHLGVNGWGPNPGDALPCVNGDARPVIGTRTPRLRARVSDPDGGMLNASFRTYKGTTSNHTWDGTETTTYNVPSGSFAEVTVPGGRINAEGVHTWNLWSTDGALVSWSGTCEVDVDTVTPPPPSVKSTQYPAGVSSGGVGRGGLFEISPPAGNTDKITGYLYTFTGQGEVRSSPAQVNGTAVVSWSPIASGPFTLSVKSVDRAGNISATATTYSIVVSDYQALLSAEVAHWSFEDSLVDTAETKSLSYTGPLSPDGLPGGFFGEGHDGRGVITDQQAQEFYQSSRPLIRTDRGFSVSAWARLDGDGGDFSVLSQDGNRTSGFDLRYEDAVDRWAIAFTDSDTDGATAAVKALSDDPPVPGAWTHLTGVYDATAGKLRLYVDGALDGEATVTGTRWNAAGPFVVGAAKAAGHRARHFTGVIDTVRVHDHALTATEVSGLTTGSSASPVAEYAFEDNLLNSGANNNLGSPVTTQYTKGYAGRGIKTDLSTGQRPVTTGPVVDTGAGFSVTAWARLGDKTRHNAVVSQDGTRLSGFVLRYAPDVDRWIFGTAGTDSDSGQFRWAIGTSSPQVGVWTHLAAVYDQDLGKIRLYVNGVREAETSVTPGFSATGRFVVGAAKQVGNGTSHFTGDIDEVTAYDDALSAVEPALAANSPVARARYLLDETAGVNAADAEGGPTARLRGSGVSWAPTGGKQSANFLGHQVENGGSVPGVTPLASWSLDGTVTDSSGNGRDLVHSNNSGPTAANHQTGFSGQAVTLNGTDQRLQRSSIIDTTAGFTVSAWVKLTRTDGWFTVMSQDGNRTSPFVLQYDHGADRWSFGMTTGDVDAPGVARAQSKQPPRVGSWTHLAGVYNAGTDKVQLYVDGQLEGENTWATPWLSSGSFAVGRLKYNGADADFFPGSMDELRVYGQALNAEQVNGLWHLGSSITAAKPDAFRADQSFTLSGWVNPTSYDQGTRMAFGLDTTGPHSGLAVGLAPQWNRWAVLVEGSGGNAAQAQWLLSDNPASDYEDQNGWVHLAVAYDAPGKRVLLYVNGVRQNTVPTNDTQFEPATPSTPYGWYAGANTTLKDASGVLIGRNTWNGVGAHNWRGAVRDVRVFSGVVPPTCDHSPVCATKLASA